MVKTTTDPYLGRVSLVRVFSGTLRPDIPIHVSGHGMTDRGHPDHDVDERIGAVSSPLGAAAPGRACGRRHLRRRPARQRRDRRHAVLPDDPRLVPPWDLLPAALPMAVEAASRADEDRLAAALARLVAEDPTVRSSAGPTPVSCCCGAWGRRTPRSSSSGCAAGTGSA